MTRVSERNLRLLVAAVFAAGIGLSAWAWGQVDLSTGLAFATAALVTELLPARMREGVDVTLVSVVILTAVVVGGPALAICAAAGVPALGWRHYPDRRLQKSLFNFGQTALSAGAAAAVFLMVVGQTAAVESPWTWTALLVAGITYTIINCTLVALAIRLASGERLLSTLGSILGTSMMLQVLYAGLAIVAAALLVGAGPEALVFLVIPAIVARHGLLAHQRESEAYDRLVNALLKAVEAKDGYTAGHTSRVAILCIEVARAMGANYGEVRAMHYAAKLHDIGKLGVPTAVIRAPRSLRDDEMALIHEHPILGAEILAEIDFLRPAIDGVRYHHERVDGGGYPHGLRGEGIPLLARIITVCDAFDAMTSTRPYRRAMELDVAFAELHRCAGTQFDPEVVRVLEAVVDRLGWEPTREAHPTSGGPVALHAVTARDADPAP